MDRQEILGTNRFVITIAIVKPGETPTLSQLGKSWAPSQELGNSPLNPPSFLRHPVWLPLSNYTHGSYLAAASGARRLVAWLQQPMTQFLRLPAVVDQPLTAATVCAGLIVSWVALPTSPSMFRWDIGYLFPSPPDEWSQVGDGILWTY